jgi:predicted Zn-dependent protease with MMP-like domain
MFSVSEQQFEDLVASAMDDLPARYQKNLNNVVVVVEDLPTKEQMQKQKLGPHQTLLGLYEGIPLTSRGNNYSLVLPDKITLFKKPIEHMSTTLEELAEQIRHTLWHEVAHYYGLNHHDISKKE